MKYISITLSIILILLPYSAYGLTDTAQLFVGHNISAQGYCAMMLDAVDRQQELTDDVRELFAQAQYSFLLDDLSEELSRRGLWETIIAYLAISEQPYATTTTSSFDQPGTSDEIENFDFSAEREKIFSALGLTTDDCADTIRQKYEERYKKLLRTYLHDSLVRSYLKAVYNDDYDKIRNISYDFISGLTLLSRRRALRDMFDLAVLSAAIAPEGSRNRAARISTAIFIKETAAHAGFDINTIDIRLHRLPQEQFLSIQNFSNDLTKQLRQASKTYYSIIKPIILGDLDQLPYGEFAHRSLPALQKILALAQRAAQEKPDQEDRGKIVETIAQRYTHMRDTVAAQELVKQQKSLGKRKYQKGSSIETDHRDQRMATTTSNVLTASLQAMMQEQETSKSTIANVLAGDMSTAVDAQTNSLATALMTPPGTLYVEDIQENVNPSVLHVLQELDFDFDAGAQQNLAAMLVTPSDPIATPHDTQH